MWSQSRYAVRLDWGAVGAQRIAAPDGVLVVVDVLSFSTAVSVLCDHGVAVYPAPWKDDRVEALAARVGAVPAVGRREVTPASRTTSRWRSSTTPAPRSRS